MLAPWKHMKEADGAVLPRDEVFLAAKSERASRNAVNKLTADLDWRCRHSTRLNSSAGRLPRWASGQGLCIDIDSVGDAGETLPYIVSIVSSSKVLNQCIL